MHRITGPQPFLFLFVLLHTSIYKSSKNLRNGRMTRTRHQKLESNKLPLLLAVIGQMSVLCFHLNSKGEFFLKDLCLLSDNVLVFLFTTFPAKLHVPFFPISVVQIATKGSSLLTVKSSKGLWLPRNGHSAFTVPKDKKPRTEVNFARLVRHKLKIGRCSCCLGAFLETTNFSVTLSFVR